MGKDKESEVELSINSLLFHCFCSPSCQSKSHGLKSHFASVTNVEMLGQLYRSKIERCSFGSEFRRLLM